MPKEIGRGDRLVGLCVFGLVLFSPPLLLLFGRGDTLFGLPLLYVYIFATWLSLIAAVALVAERRSTFRRDDGA